MDVTVFSKAGCGGCVATKANLKKRGIEYHEVRVDQNEEAMASFMRAGFSGVPVVMAFRNDEDEVPDVITGFHTDFIDALGKDGDIPDLFAAR